MSEYKEVHTPEEFAAAVEGGVKVFKNFDSPRYDELVLSWSPSSLLIIEWEHFGRFEGSHSAFPGMFKKDMFTPEVWRFYQELLENG